MDAGGFEEEVDEEVGDLRENDKQEGGGSLKTESISEQDSEERADSLSRRGFLKGVGILAAGGVAGAVIPASASETAASSASASASAAASASASASAAASGSGSAALSDAGEIFNGVKMAIGHIVHNPDLCAGCRTCEIVCATYHEGVASSELSRIQWTKDVEGGCTTDIMTCKQCVGPECLASCPTGALHVDEETGARVIDPDVCIGCQTCLNSCPATPSRIRFNAEKSICFKCDLCGGDPQCVKYCPTGALTAS